MGNMCAQKPKTPPPTAPPPGHLQMRVHENGEASVRDASGGRWVLKRADLEPPLLPPPGQPYLRYEQPPPAPSAPQQQRPQPQRAADDPFFCGVATLYFYANDNSWTAQGSGNVYLKIHRPAEAAPVLIEAVANRNGESMLKMLAKGCRDFKRHEGDATAFVWSGRQEGREEEMTVCVKLSSPVDVEPFLSAFSLASALD
eukprot:Hpha_TRINITY_DN14071_c1_g1::TRINITY_DN14071_c1_g1_i1::g.43933::m.43933